MLQHSFMGDVELLWTFPIRHNGEPDTASSLYIAEGFDHPRAGTQTYATLAFQSKPLKPEESRGRDV
jgi:hypothetical protein